MKTLESKLQKILLIDLIYFHVDYVMDIQLYVTKCK